MKTILAQPKKIFLIFICLFGIFFLFTSHLLADDDNEEYLEKKYETETSIREARQLPNVFNEKWKTECSSCHMLYQPGLLPERSWVKMMGDLENHFGENASLDTISQKEITNFLVVNSSDRSNNRRGQKILKTIDKNEAPLRISETKYFIRKHREIAANVYKRKSIGSPANCVACHSGAERGDYSEENVRIPKDNEFQKKIKSAEVKQVVDQYLSGK